MGHEGNTFKKGDMVIVAHRKEHGPTRVKYTNGPYVYYEHPTYSQANAHHDNCTLVAQPKFAPGDVVRNSADMVNTIKCVKTNYGGGHNDSYSGPLAYDYIAQNGWDLEEGLTLVTRAETITDLLKAGKRVEAIKQHRIIHGTGLKEAMEAINEIEKTLPHKFGFVAAVAAPKATPKFKVGDIVKHIYYHEHYEINDVREDGHFYVKKYPYAGYNDPQYYELVVSPVPHIVIRKDTGKGYRPNDKPRVHNSLAEATKEAERLALANPGVEFATFSLAGTSTATAPVAGTVTTVVA